MFANPLRPTRATLLRSLQGSSLSLALSLAAILSAVSPGSAQATLISTSACNDATLSQPFRSWGDSSAYELLPGGDFESSPTGWTLSGGAQTVAGSEPYAATGSLGSSSLSLPEGASARSPFTCVDAAYPTFRFFARNLRATSTVLVSVLYRTVAGTVSLPLGAVALGDGWQPTLPMLTGSAAAGLLANGTAQVALNFTALTGSSRIDDVFVDPRMR